MVFSADLEAPITTASDAAANVGIRYSCLSNISTGNLSSLSQVIVKSFS